METDNEVRLSPSIAKILLNESPAHAYAAHSKLGKKPRKSTASMDKGKVIDRLVFGKGPAVYVKGKKGADDVEVCAAAYQDREDQPIHISNDVYQECCDVALAVHAGLVERNIKISPELSQVKWLWTSVDEVKCKCIADLWDGSETVYDLKTASDMSDSGITKAIELYGYDIQAAAEIEAVRVLHGFTPRFRWIFVETGQVNDVRVIDPDRYQLDYGIKRWTEAVIKWGQCMKFDKWPGRPDAVLGPSQYRVGPGARDFLNQIKDK